MRGNTSIRIKLRFKPFVILVQHLVPGLHRPPFVDAKDPKGVVAIFANAVEFFRVGPRDGEEFV